ncbi:nodulation protein NfeD [Radiobacillus kanasensis]|uniref:NfeD family protein n=1 Tax=Radiobacillus kanasensis TaxID=2844358 RepID=UPI001E4FB446|nr:NfeD family protein [Radiobacillus kanasensis]UFT97794.1 nodulation protein NfeD [Radiobacillus kanasensis]
MELLDLDWITFVITGLGTLFLFGELLVNRKGVFGLLGIAFISVYFLSYLEPGTFFLMITIYFVGLLLIIIDGKLLNDGTLSTIGTVAMLISVGLTAPNWTAGFYAILGVIIGGLSSFLFLKVYKRRDMWTKMALLDRLTKEEGYNSINSSYESLLNETAVTVTDMRPVGTIRIGEQEYSAISNGKWIEKGTSVRIAQVDGTRILVTELNTED